MVQNNNMCVCVIPNGNQTQRSDENKNVRMGNKA